MKVLLDECVPRKLKFTLRNHDCQTVPEAGFAGYRNGRLLTMTESAGFEVFFTIDKGLPYQQNLVGRKIAILVVRVRSNRLADFLPHIEACQSVMDTLHPGEFVRVGNAGT